MNPATQGETPDSQLVRRARGGDLEAFELLATRHERAVYTLALRMLRHEQDAQDVTQQTFASAIEHLDSFREESSFSTWLLRIATYAALKVIRKRKGVDLVSMDAPAESEDGRLPHPEYIADWKQAPDELARRKEIRELLDRALERLDEKHRVVFLMRDVEGLSIRETAEALGITEANAKVRLLRARLLLREELTRTLGDPFKVVEPHAHE